MKTIFPIFLSFSLAFGFNNSDLDKLLKNESCKKCDLSGVNLSNFDLSTFEVEDSNFEGANLSGSNLFMSEFKNCNFKNANLSGANFWKADLRGSAFENTNAINANFKGTKLQNTKIVDSDFSKTIAWKGFFKNAFVRNTKFVDSELGDSEFFGNDLRDSNFEGSVLWQTKFENTKMTPKQCEYAKHEEAILSNVQCGADSFESFGHFQNMIQTKNLEGRVSLNDLAWTQKNIYAVGAFANANGEITIFDGELFASYGEHGSHKVFKNFQKDEQAMLLAALKPVKFYDEIVLEEDMLDVFFYDYLEEVAKKQNIDMSKPFMFVLDGDFQDVVWHIVNGKNNEQPKDGSKQKLMKKIFSNHKNINGKVFGFYTKGPQGIFTHPGENFHAHFISSDKNMAGHIDEFSVSRGVVLRLAQ